MFGGVSAASAVADEDGGGGGSRWPRQETMALLKIRSDMDSVFRDSSLKGPLWDEVSRKMGELGFQRSAKKCKEKFENVYKYHKRTKDGRASKPQGKSYQFFDQLEAMETTPLPQFNPPPPDAPPLATSAMPSKQIPSNIDPPRITSTVSSEHPLSKMPDQSIIHPSILVLSQVPQTIQHDQPSSPESNSTSSSTSSDESSTRKRQGTKRKWKDFFGRLMTDTIQRQQELQRQFLEMLEKRENDRTAREQAWRDRETARINREQDLLAHERSIAAAKDAAVIALLQRITEQNIQIPLSNSIEAQQLLANTPPPPAQPVLTGTRTKLDDTDQRTNKEGENRDVHDLPSSSSRWPKAETEALIQIRTNLDLKYQDNGSKGPLWEEVSAAMAEVGYNRSSKRCKEKWENINKYFKKVKESKKKRVQDSKTCQYFEKLDAIYKQRAKTDDLTIPIMPMPEQQWPQPENPHCQYNDNDSENLDEGKEEEEEEEGNV